MATGGCRDGLRVGVNTDRLHALPEAPHEEGRTREAEGQHQHLEPHKSVSDVEWFLDLAQPVAQATADAHELTGDQVGGEHSGTMRALSREHWMRLGCVINHWSARCVRPCGIRDSSPRNPWAKLFDRDAAFALNRWCVPVWDAARFPVVDRLNAFAGRSADACSASLLDGDLTAVCVHVDILNGLFSSVNISFDRCYTLRV